MTEYEDFELGKFILILILGENKTKIFNTWLFLSNIKAVMPKKKKKEGKTGFEAKYE